MKTFVEKIVRFPYLVIFSILLITLFFLTQIFNIELKFDPKAILPQDDPIVQRNNRIEETFGGSRVVVIGVHSRDGNIFNTESLAKIKAITDEVKLIAGIKEENVISIADRKIKYIVGTEGEIDITQLMPEVPTTPEGLAALRKRVFSNELFLDGLVSRDGSSAAIVLDFTQNVPLDTFDDSDLPEGAFGDLSEMTQEGEWSEGASTQAPEKMDTEKSESTPDWEKWQDKKETVVETSEPEEEDWRKWQKTSSNCEAWQISEPGTSLRDSYIHCQLLDIIDKQRDDKHNFYLGGMPVVLTYFEADAFQMLVVLFPLAVLIIGILHYVAFRTWQGLIIPLVTSLLSVAWAMGIMGVTGTHLDPWNAMTPILILAIAAGHSVQILKRYYEEYERLGDNKAAVIESTTQVGTAMITAGLIASASFASLITFQLKTFQAFGLFIAFGVLSALFLELTFIPALRTVLKPSKKKAKKALKPDIIDRFLNRLATIINDPGGRKKILSGGVIFFIVSIFGATLMKVSNSNRSQFFESTQLRKDDKALNEKFAGTSTFYILLEETKKGALKEPEVASAINRLQRRLEEVQEVGKTESYVDYVKQMNQTIKGGDPAFLKVPESREEISQFLFLYSISGNPADFARLMRPQQDEAIIWVFMRTDDTLLAETLIDIVDEAKATDFNQLGVEIGVAGSTPVVVALNKEMVRGKAQNMLQITAITFLMTAFFRRSLLGGLFVIIPLGLSVLINFGVMGFTGIHLGIGTAAISAMAVGIGADYEIYLIFRLREEIRKRRNVAEAVKVTLLTSGKAIIFVAIAVSSGYGMLAFTGYYLHMEGILVPLAMLTSCLGALAILPSLVLVFRPKFVFGGLELDTPQNTSIDR
ncbi:MAG: MMPL family transporter [Nitrospirota bacterium]|nr:MMPL family transporter [Nitrospirota bacterium]